MGKAALSKMTYQIEWEFILQKLAQNVLEYGGPTG